MDNRETKEVLLPVSKAKVVVYTYLTFGEIRQINRVPTSHASVTFNEDNKPTVSAIPGTVGEEMQDLTFSFLVKEITDSEGKAVEDKKSFINNLRQEDGEFLLQVLDEVSQGSSLSAEGKKK